MLARFSHAARRTAVLLVSGGFVAAAAYLPATPVAEPVERVIAAPSPTPAPTPAPTPVPEFTPETVVIEAIGVEAPVVPVGTEADGAMGTPSNARDIGWWEPVPTGAGNTLLAGHVSWNRQAGSFSRLKELVPGDIVTVRGEGQELTFRVEWTDQVRGDTPAGDILGDVGEPVVTLITCGGEFDRSIRSHVDRIVVRGVLAG